MSKAIVFNDQTAFNALLNSADFDANCLLTFESVNKNIDNQEIIIRKSLLFLIAEQKHDNVIFFEKLVKKGGDLTVGNHLKEPPLFAAIANANKKIINYLLKQPHFNLNQFYHHQTALNHLAQQRQPDLLIIKQLIDSGAWVSQAQGLYESALGAAVAQKNLPLAKLLLDKGAKPTESYQQKNCLELALLHPEQTALIELLVKAGATYQSVNLAHIKADLKLWESVLAKGADISKTTMSTVLHTDNEPLEAIKFLLSKGISPNQTALDETPLELCVNKNFVTTAKLLLEKGANLNRKKGGTSYLMQAASSFPKSEAMMELLLNDKNIELAEVDKCLNLAISLKNRLLFEYLIKKGADLKKAKIGQQNDEQFILWLLDKGIDIQTVDLSWCIKTKQTQLIETLLKKGYHPTTEQAHLAVHERNAEALRLILEHYTKLEALHDKMTMLGLAVEDGYEEGVKILLAKGANPNVILGNEPLIFTALEHEDKNIVQLLIAHPQTNLEESIEQNGIRITPLSFCWAHRWSADYLMLAERLLDKGVNPNSIFLAEVIKERKMTFAEKLLEKNIDLNALMSSGEPPLHFALVNDEKAFFDKMLSKGADIELLALADYMQYGKLSFEKIKFLTERKINLNKAGKSGLLPLNYAATDYPLEVCQYLLEKGASTKQKNTLNQSVIQYAKEKNASAEMLNLLKK